MNKVETGVRLRYKYKDPDTGEEEEILIENTETRSQLDNRENALRLLRSQLYDRELQKRMAEQAKVEAGKKKIEWGSQIRSYVFDDRRPGARATLILLCPSYFLYRRLTSSNISCSVS